MRSRAGARTGTSYLVAERAELDEPLTRAVRAEVADTDGILEIVAATGDDRRRS